MRYPRDPRIMAGLLPIMWSTGTGSEITADGLSSSSKSFSKSLDLSSAASSGSYRLSSASALPTSRVQSWMSVTRDGENGLQAAAGMTWNIK